MIVPGGTAAGFVSIYSFARKAKDVGCFYLLNCLVNSIYPDVRMALWKFWNGYGRAKPLLRQPELQRDKRFMSNYFSKIWNFSEVDVFLSLFWQRDI